MRARLETSRHALRAGAKLRLTYAVPGQEPANRTVRPLSLEFWGHDWTLTAWCELRSDFRAFRLDRMGALVSTGETFRPESGKTLADFLERPACTAAERPA